jgi:hypothetical protein
MIVEPNWGIFRAKFNGREEKAFEWLCSLLFSKEHNQSIGPLRYFNQAGIEEDPISVGGEVIGWQAKFVGRLSDQTATLKTAIDDAKRKNPSLTRIYFYVSADFTQSTKRHQGTYPIHMDGRWMLDALDARTGRPLVSLKILLSVYRRVGGGSNWVN